MGFLDRFERFLDDVVLLPDDLRADLEAADAAIDAGAHAEAEQLFLAVLAEHRKYLPAENRKPAPGSRARILLYTNGKVNWQGRDVGPKDPIPGLESE